MNADQTHTIRSPRGTAARIRAATGQPLSSLVRIILIELLAKYEAEGNVRNVPAEARADVREVVQSTKIEGTDDGQDSNDA